MRNDGGVLSYVSLSSICFAFRVFPCFSPSDPRGCFLSASLPLSLCRHSRSARIDSGQRRFYARGRVYFGIPVGRTSCCGVGACFSHDRSHIINVLFIIDQLWIRSSCFKSVACELWDGVLFCFSCIGFWYPTCPMVICSVALRHSGSRLVVDVDKEPALPSINFPTTLGVTSS